jgi:hypothetical protein
LLAIVAYYISKDFKPRTILLALSYISSLATGLTLATLIYKQPLNFSITKKVAYFIANNAQTNNVAVCYITRFIPKCKQENYLRCTDYTISLSINASFAKTLNKKALKDALNLNNNNAPKVAKLFSIKLLKLRDKMAK